VGALVEGLQTPHADDHVLLDHEMTMFEALYRSFERAARRAGAVPVARRRPRSTTPRHRR
jgi:hypothetical protein